MIEKIASGLMVLAYSAGVATAIETPPFETMVKEGKFELRKYEAIPLASTEMDGMKTRNEGFGRLFKYISGENEQSQEIKMTAPVLMEDSPKDEADGKTGKMSFVIPAKVAEAGIPQPKSEELEIRKMQSGKIAVLRFSGWKDEAKRETAVKELKEWAVAQGLKAEGQAFFAFYNPPWTPEILRRNEVWLRVTGP